MCEDVWRLLVRSSRAKEHGLLVEPADDAWTAALTTAWTAALTTVLTATLTAVLVTISTAALPAALTAAHGALTAVARERTHAAAWVHEQQVGPQRKAPPVDEHRWGYVSLQH